MNTALVHRLKGKITKEQENLKETYTNLSDDDQCDIVKTPFLRGGLVTKFITIRIEIGYIFKPYISKIV